MRWGVWFLIIASLWGSAAVFRAPSRQQELRVLITARNMVEAGDPLHFEFQNQPRYRKPPLAYWIAAAGYTLTGNTFEAWSGRLFFVLIALGGLFLLADAGGIKAAILMAATFGATFYAPLAETDFLQLSFMILAFWAWKKDQGFLAGLGMACATMAKGPGGAVIPLLSFWILQRGSGRTIRFWLPALFLPFAASVGWILYLRYDPVASAALAQDLQDTFLDSAHTNPFPYYVWTLPLIMLPALFALGLVESLKDSSETRIPKVWFWVTFVLLTLTVSKQRHYALMLLPPACWWLAAHLPGWRPSRNALGGLALLVLLGSCGMYWFGEQGQHSRFLEDVQQVSSNEGTLHVVGINSARFDFHLGRHVENTHSAQHAYDRAAAGDLIVVVRKSLSEQPPLPGREPLVDHSDSDWERVAYRKMD